MRIQKLSWAGAAVIGDDQHLLIDPLENAAPFANLLGHPLWPLFSVPDVAQQTSVLVTHRHLDHFDAGLLRRIVKDKGHVYCPNGMAQEVKNIGLEATGLDAWETVSVGSFKVTAVPAVDWRGDDQVSWVVEHGTKRLFHGGDTIWHGSWWNIAKRFGNFDVAMLPVNGVVAQFPGIEPSNLPATLTPEQAAIAARLLKAQLFCPIHYGQFHAPPTYSEQSEIETRLRRSAEAEHVALRIVRDGEFVL